MNDKRNVMIAVLGATALIMLSIAIGVHTSEPPAYANAAVKQGDYIMVAGQMNSSTDLVYVVDIAARQLVVYFPDRRRGIQNASLETVDKIDLEKAFR